MRPATTASPTCCAPAVLIVVLQLVSPAAPNPAPPSGKLAKCTTPASRPAASTAATANSPCETGPDRSPLRRCRALRHDSGAAGAGTRYQILGGVMVGALNVRGAADRQQAGMWLMSGHQQPQTQKSDPTTTGNGSNQDCPNQ